MCVVFEESQCKDNTWRKRNVRFCPLMSVFVRFCPILSDLREITWKSLKLPHSATIPSLPCRDEPLCIKHGNPCKNTPKTEAGEGVKGCAFREVVAPCLEGSKTQPATRNFFWFSFGVRVCVRVPYIYKLKLKKIIYYIELRCAGLI